jgi:hypothetical protein
MNGSDKPINHIMQNIKTGIKVVAINFMNFPILISSLGVLLISALSCFLIFYRIVESEKQNQSGYNVVDELQIIFQFKPTRG